MNLDLAIALACICSPASVDIPPCRLDAIQSVAVSLEVMDERERKYLFVRKDDFKYDIGLIQRRYSELKDAPPACDAERFPTRETMREWIAFNREYVCWLQDRKRFHKDGWIDEAIVDCECIQRVFDSVCDARCDYYYVTVRRSALASLREAIGEHSYYAGTLPPIVPAWWFWRTD